ncbi:carboxymuconolactone decarboxylase family protein [Actinokineospora globicatena]|uniref:carboxymuconolactone decarboxylase family protein n=1 Tax=Actinokineospora globicatena TaxID=103729 RepID=UPI0020A3A476|nr:carboxymuconolactone decarboxylase family protein [Actinokineospora globicatena]MCP2305883.1 alkylhydroperoxidase AhpD family core domain-containing protein [Actinokineospora globicatena]GLW80248.1 alkyl hydroperoxide reductase AhpD [Actinokineospora globicatena]GLW87077.1 alkyl hydroperoxide reductase AhpD [Actinokineospora globicatena]
MTRVNLAEAWPDGFRALYAFHSTIVESGLDPVLIQLIFTRASQLNGCAFCLDMHTLDAQAAGETPQRLLLLDAWRETDLYTEQERAALALTESITDLIGTHVPDDVYAEAARVFDEPTLAKVIMTATLINAWNRTGITQRKAAGQYKPQPRR